MKNLKTGKLKKYNFAGSIKIDNEILPYLKSLLNNYKRKIIFINLSNGNYKLNKRTFGCRFRGRIKTFNKGRRKGYQKQIKQKIYLKKEHYQANETKKQKKLKSNISAPLNSTSHVRLSEVEASNFKLQISN
ncbi:MAG: hypothetical protein LBE36_00990 [Flavobacteriaceae bacterium]|nr:hypothetical protein [Flavobacteriaceae bacterium]